MKSQPPIRRLLNIIFPLLVLSLTGCAKLAHMQELLRLKDYSDNKEVQAKYVKEQDRKFEQLLAAVRESKIESYQNKKNFLAEFGNPVFSRQVTHAGKTMDMWLYRYTTKYFSSEKVYLYFDQAGKLQDWEKK